MATQTDVKTILLSCCAFALLTGCASVPSETQRQSDPGSEIEYSEIEQPTVQEPVAQSIEASPIEKVLADRRRSEYPEIETEAYGFTITEQVRIAGDAHSRYDRAVMLLQQDRFEEAIAELLALTADAPQITAPYVDLGIAYGRVGDLERAAEALETAALLAPEHPIVRNELGIVYRRSGRFDDARAEYEKALAVFSDFHFARRNLAVLCDLYLADVECALQNYRMYLESVGEDSEVEIWIADLASRSGQNL